MVGSHWPLLGLLLGCSLLRLLLGGSRGRLLLCELLLLLLLHALGNCLLLLQTYTLHLGQLCLMRHQLLLAELLLHCLLLLNEVHGHAGLGADDAHAAVGVLHGHARLARLPRLLHEVIVLV